MKSLKSSAWVQPQKRQNDLGFLQKQIIQHVSNPSLCPIHWSEGTEGELLYDGLQNLAELTPKKVLFMKEDWNANEGGQVIHWLIGEFGLEV